MTEFIFYEDGGFCFLGSRLDFGNYEKQGNIYYLAIETYRAKMLYENDKLLYDLQTESESERMANSARIQEIAKYFILFTIGLDGVQALEASGDALKGSPEYILVLQLKDLEHLKAQCKAKRHDNPLFSKSNKIQDYMKLHFYGRNTV
ncbi:hypothetical protein GGI09_005201 [Coemansia sp. S100]|nr:hypothetical protein GGI09_005201 [Coemansia sp. S100]